VTKRIDVPAWSSPRKQLSDVETDCERRDRGFSLAAWNNAPLPPSTKEECTNGARPCPALRCWFHCGDRGDGSLSCVLDVDRAMSQDKVASVLGVSKRRVQLIEADARDSFKRANDVHRLVQLRKSKT
jgi:hypothetical protein